MKASDKMIQEVHLHERRDIIDKCAIDEENNIQGVSTMRPVSRSRISVHERLGTPQPVKLGTPARPNTKSRWVSFIQFIIPITTC